MEYLNYVDHKLFLWLQENIQASNFNFIITVWRDRLFWVPLYIVMFSFLIFKFRQKAIYWVLLILITVSISDQLSSRCIKKLIKRERPCQEFYFKDQFESKIDCGVGYSMPSSHAANHMAIAAFFFFSLASTLPGVRWFLLLWAVSIGFAQIIVGVHFPFDVIVGLCLGFSIGALVQFIAIKYARAYLYMD